MPKQGPNSAVDLSIHDGGVILSRWRGRPTTCRSCRPLHGGACYAVFALQFDSPPYRAVVKIDAAPDGDGLARERRRLDYIKAHSPFPAPAAYYADDSRQALPFRFLLMEAIEGVTLVEAPLAAPGQAPVDRELAEAVAELHTHRRATFGPIDEPGTADWRDVFLPRLVDLRGDMQTRLAPAVLADIDAALRRAPAALAEAAAPTLVHGDLWGGNILLRRTDDGWHLSGVVDWPALQYADAEYELAYLEAWNTVTPAFFDVYRRRHPMRDGYDARRLFYWLHTYMLHVWLFGDDRYRRLTAQTAARIAREA